MRAIVVGAGVGGLACAVHLAHAGHDVVVLERGAAPGGKCARVTRGEFRFDAGPSLLTMPQVFRHLFAATGAPLDGELELLRVEPVTEYHFADGSTLALSGDLPSALEALDAWSPGSARDWMAFLATCARMWAASDAFLRTPWSWPPRRPPPRQPNGEPALRPLDALRVRPWSTLRALARAHTRDRRLQMVIERFATYAGGDPRRCPAALAVAGYVEHAFGAWYPRGGMYGLVEALVRRLQSLGGELRLDTPATAIVVRDGRAREVATDSGALSADVVITDIDEAILARHLVIDGRPEAASPSPFVSSAQMMPDRSLSGLALLLGLRGRSARQPHHLIRFPADYDAEFDDLFVHRRPVREPTLYVSAPAATDPDNAPPGAESWLALVNAPAIGDAVDWRASEAAVIERLGVAERIVELVRRTPGDLQRETGALGGAIYGAAPHGRLAALRRAGNRLHGVGGLWLLGGTVHPGGGLPMVALGAATVAREIGPA